MPRMKWPSKNTTIAPVTAAARRRAVVVLKAAEVRAGIPVRVEAARRDPRRRDDGRARAHLPNMSFERGGDPLVGQERGEDPARQIAESLERCVRPLSKPIDDPLGLR